MLPSFRIWILSIFVAFGFFLMGGQVQAATIYVDSLGNTGGAGCELREAITSANTNSASGGCTTGASGTDEIFFATGTAGTIDISNQDLPTITSGIQINYGIVADVDDIEIIIDAGQTASRRIFTVAAGASSRLDLNYVHLRGGRQTDGGCIAVTGQNIFVVVNAIIAEDCVASGNGGAFYIRAAGIGTAGGMGVYNSRIIDNSAVGNGGVVWMGTSGNLTTSANEIERNTADNGAVFYTSSTATSTLGILGVYSSTIESNTSTNGGAIFVHNVTTTLNQSIFRNNIAGNVGATEPGVGAAFYVEETRSVTIGASEFRNNAGVYSGNGGAVFMRDSSSQITGTLFDGNISDYGGGIYMQGGTTTMDGTFFQNNFAAVQGGGLHGSLANLTLTAVDFSYNTSTLGGGISLDTANVLTFSSGGFIGNTALSEGGGVWTYDTTSTFTNTTFDGNDASNGKAINLESSTMDLYNNTFSSNGPSGLGGVLRLITAIFSFANNIFDGNGGDGIEDICVIDSGGAITSLGTNLFDGDGTDCNAVGTDIINTSADLLPLIHNGGSSLSRYPNVGSPVVDAANAAYAPADDQIGTVRPFGAAYDIGAIEYVDATQPTLAEVTPVPTPATDTTPTYTFSSDEAGTIDYLGICTSITTAAVVGNNTITFDTLGEGTYDTCELTVTDAALNPGYLAISAFTITAPPPPSSGGGGGATTAGDTTPPVISNVQAINVMVNAASITWQTSEAATSIVEYGVDTSYPNGSVSNLTLVGSHQLELSGLLPGTLYHFRASSRDSAGNFAQSGDNTFTTASTSVDIAPPAAASFLNAVGGDRVVSLDWNLPSDSDLAGMRLVRRTGAFPSGPFDGTLVYDGFATAIPDTAVTNGVTYFYAIFAYDRSGNYSSRTVDSATPNGEVVVPRPPTPEGTPVPTPEPEPEPTPNPQEPNEPSGEPSGEESIRIAPELYDGDDGARPLVQESSGEFSAEPGSLVRLIVPVSELDGEPESASVTVNGSSYPLTPSSDGRSYQATFRAPPSGRYTMVVAMTFTDGRSARSEVVLLSKTEQPGIPATSSTPAVIASSTALGTTRFANALYSAWEFLKQPSVQTATEDAIAPALIAIAIINVAAALPVLNAFALLQYLISQPILLLGRRRRNKWGIVYNSLTKQPVELAIIRLIDQKTGVVVQTMVTDKLGRYVFSPKPGTYRLEVLKDGYAFPSQHLKDKDQDVDFVDLYHGSVVEIAQDGMVAVNIPLDPVVAEETPKKILFKKFLRGFQQQLALLTVIASLIALIIVPSVQVALITLGQVGIYLLFRRFAMPKAAKEWGIVFDPKTRAGISQVIVRIFDKKFNKLLETQVTDANGKYGFFVRRNVYYVTAEKQGYEKFVSPDIDLTNTDEAVVDQSIALVQAKK